MPRATVSHTGVRHDLKSCPGGFVELRQLSYDEILARRDGVTNLSIEREQAEMGGDDVRMQINTMQKWAREFDFRNCIRDHNLEDDNGQPLDFTKSHTFRILDPKIGREIEALIDQLNGDNDDEASMQPFTSAAGSFSTEESGDKTWPIADSVETQ